MEEIQKRYIPDFSRYNEILVVDGQPINDVNFVQNQRAEVASLLGSNVALNENYDEPYVGTEDDAFDTWIPKGVQSADEIMTYIDYLNKKIDYE